MPRIVRFASALAYVALSVRSNAQAVQTVDQGSFTITINGQRAGREDFRIYTTPNGTTRDYVAKATVVYGDRRLMPELRADSLGTPNYYTVEDSSSGTDHVRWKGTIVQGRVSAKIDSPRGESAKEFIVTNGALVLDDDVFHQYYFVARQTTNGTATVVIPRRNTQLSLRVSSAGADHTTIGTQEIDSNHVVLREASGAQRDLWIDHLGRVLKVAIPARGIIALRDDPPK